MGRNCIVLPCRFGRWSSHAPSPAAANCPRALQTTPTDDSMQNNTGPLGGPVIRLTYTVDPSTVYDTAEEQAPSDDTPTETDDEKDEEEVNSDADSDETPSSDAVCEQTSCLLIWLKWITSKIK